MFGLITISKHISTIQPLWNDWIIAELPINKLVNLFFIICIYCFEYIFNASHICNRCLENLADKQNATIASRERICSEGAAKKSNESNSGIDTFCTEDNMPSDNFPAIIGSLVTVIVLLILLGLAVVLFFRLRKIRNKKRPKGKLSTQIVKIFLKWKQFL